MEAMTYEAVYANSWSLLISLWLADAWGNNPLPVTATDLNASRQVIPLPQNPCCDRPFGGYPMKGESW